MTKTTKAITTEPVDRALTREQTAAMTGIKPKTLANWAVLNQGPPVRKRRTRCFYLESEVLAWLRGLPIVAGERTATK